MDRTALKINLNERLYLRDPQETELGRKILSESIIIIDSLGFEQFTFKKLAHSIDSTEASVYRYFENKQKLLIYIISWYWVWLDYRIQFETHNIVSPKEKLKLVIRVFCEIKKPGNNDLINYEALYRIVVSESSKAYLIKDVDEINKEGAYREYKKLCARIADIILEINPTYKYAKALISTSIEAAHQQVYFSLHLPSLTDIKHNAKVNMRIEDFIEHIIFKAIEA